MSRARADVPALRAQQDREIFAEQTVKLFGNPRYQSSPSYRREVEDFIKANADMIDKQAGTRVRDRSLEGVSRGEMPVTSYDDAREAIRVQKIAAAQQRAKESHELLDQHIKDEIGELGQDRRSDPYSPA